MTNKEFTPKQWVLVRDSYTEPWRLNIYSHIKGEYFFCVGSYWCYCIPYEGNEHLLGTTDEPKEPYEPKEGDFVFIQGVRKHISIYAGIQEANEDVVYDEICSFADIMDDDVITLGEREFVVRLEKVKEIRPATEEEKQLLLDRLHGEGKDWDAENKKVVDWKWQPQKDESYYCPTYDPYKGGFCAHEVAWEGLYDECDKWNYEIGWTFRTEDECQAFCDKLNESIKNVQ